MTSHDVVNIVRKTIHSRKVGHTGTLDPDATGVLVIAINEGTKVIPFLEEAAKVYSCQIVIGVSTTTEDASGEIVNILLVETLSTEQVDQALKKLVGTHRQTPPMYSAVKVDGKKLYEYARQHIEIERPSKEVMIHEITRTSEIFFQNNTAIFSFIARVSKGTYIRTLCVEIGAALGFPAHMKDLVRTQSGVFTLDEAVSIEQLKAEKFTVIPILHALTHLPQIEVSDEIAGKIKDGMKLSEENLKTTEDQVVLKNKQNELLAIYERGDLKQYRAVRVWK